MHRLSKRGFLLIACGAAWLSLLASLSATGEIGRSMELLDKALKMRPAPARGAQIYREYCVGCHGADASGNAAEVIPALAGQRDLYLLKQLIDFVELGRDTPEMHRLMARSGLASPQSWRDLSTYLSNLRANARPEAGDGQALTTGGRVYKEVCAECHGNSGQGDAAGSTPALRGQHYSYLVLQLRGFASGHRLDIELPVLEYIAGLSLEELEGVADYVSRFSATQPETI